MKRLDIAKSATQGAGVATISFGADHYEKLVGHDLMAFDWGIFWFALLLTAIGVGALFHFCIEKSWLIRRMIMGRYSMEADWTDFAINRRTGKLINIAFTETTYRNGYFCFDGMAWYPDDDRLLHWRTLQSEYDEQRLLYRYETWWSRDAHEKKEQGAGVIEFESERNRIERYSGKFIDGFHLQRCANYGERVRHSILGPRRLTPEEKLSRAQAYCEARLPEVRRELGFAT